jgi:hypothetical protein
MFLATDGSVFQDRRDPAAEAAVASAAHDLQCDPSSITVAGQDWYSAPDVEVDRVPTVLEGCGARVAYQVVHAEELDDSAGRYVLVSRSPISLNTSSGALGVSGLRVPSPPSVR